MKSQQFSHCGLTLVTLIALASCGGPSGPRVSRGQALQWHDILTVKVLKVWDLMEYHVEAEPHLSHMVKIRVLAGPPEHIGKELILPYDDYALANSAQGRAPPPGSGEILTIMPSQWVGEHAARGRRRRWE